MEEAAVQDSDEPCIYDGRIASNIDGIGPLLDKRIIDPACGSGIFLVGIFNRLRRMEEEQPERPL